MSAEKRFKINNSYESEPSSGSSLSEPLEYNSVYDASMHLPYILKPPSYETEVIIQADGNYYISSQENKIPLISAMSNSLPGIYEEPSPSRSNETVASRPISLESAFKGFTESPYGKLQRQFFPTTSVSAHLPDSFEKPVPTKGNTVFSRFYDMIVEENSCNAVDIQLLNEKVSPTEIDEVSQENGVDYLLSLSKELEPVASYHQSQPLAEVELSFNGKIKSLTPPTADEKEGESTIEIQSQLNQSFILKKYSNEKSPDLFGDDDDDENEEDVDTCNYEDRYKAEELIEFVGTAVDEEATEIIENENQVEIVSPVAIAIDNANNDQNTVEASMDTSVNKSVNCPTESSFADEQTCELDSQQTDQPRADNYSLYRENCRREKELLRRIRKCLAGIPPPPSVTIPQLDMFSAVISRKQDILDFTVDINSSSSLGAGSTSNTCASLFKPTHPIDETKEMGWRQVLGVRQHGLSFNLCKASENNEYLGLSVIERFIGAETASSYRNSPSSAKKRNARMKLLTQSPGNRLSHLARRRATFSSAQLATQKSNSLRGPQILVDVQKKNKNRRKNTPKRMTPGSKKKNRKTPSSSARKRLFRCDLSKPGPSRESSKRALFQSPAKQMEQKQSVQRLMPSIKPEIANRVEKSKRALFSPDKGTENSNANMLRSNAAQQSRLSTQQFDSIFKRKRSAIDDDDSADLPSQSSKLFRGGAENLTPRALKIKSQSFCIGAGSSSTLPTTTAISGLTCIAGVETHNLMASRSSGLGSSVTLFGSTSALSSGSTAMNSGAKIQRSHSEMVAQTSNLTENQRKKLLWAVSQALQEKKITMKHESFKQYAAVLARVVRRIFQEFFQKSSTSNSETLLRLAKRYVHNVIGGRNADDIYLHAKAKIARERSESNTRLSGYIGPEEYRRRKDTQKQQQQHEEQNNSFSQNTTISASISNIFSCDKSMDSFCMTSGYETIPASNTTTQSTYSSQLFDSNSNPSSLKKLPVQPNASLQNSSSKNNMCGLALRENVNFEIEQQRRSTQKNFTGKDQRNVSPYANANSHYYHNNHSNQLIASNINSIPIAPVLCSASMGKSQLQTKSMLSAETSVLHPGSTKVKRQISFDN
ncbi:uncharacterized protein LOC120770209 isoform X1 [Bactrocera tryoni]|uniref:uncharacterized protein LOC120770209 isoform X1 n=2 Tax=Bactrocera tryoni TaxID=59916 RepID=UPI001A95A743|nr:uncharacterized protein LOC120770209 isoform X1 [Bactrocera tryoni]